MALVFGRLFVKRFILCYPTVVCSVCDVGVLCPNGWMDQDETWRACRTRPWPHCVRWGPISPPQKGNSPQFAAHICCGQVAVWIKIPLGMEIGYSPGDFVLDGDPAPPPFQKKGRSPPIFGPCLLWPNSWIVQDGTRHGGGPRSRPHCARWGPSSPPQKSGRAPQFLVHVYCGKMAVCIRNNHLVRR